MLAKFNFFTLHNHGGAIVNLKCLVCWWSSEFISLCHYSKLLSTLCYIVYLLLSFLYVCAHLSNCPVMVIDNDLSFGKLWIIFQEIPFQNKLLVPVSFMLGKLICLPLLGYNRVCWLLKGSTTTVSLHLFDFYLSMMYSPQWT